MLKPSPGNCQRTPSPVPTSDFFWILLIQHRAARDQLRSVCFEEMALPRDGQCQHTDIFFTHHPNSHPLVGSKTEKDAGEKRGVERGIQEKREEAQSHFSPPFAATIPAVGAGLRPLWGGNILLPVLGGRGRAGPFANLGGVEE